MQRGALRLCLVLCVQLRCLTPLTIPPDRGAAARRTGVGASEKLGAVVRDRRDLPEAPVGAPHGKVPQFMLDLFNAVSGSISEAENQQQILDGNVVRSFADKRRAGHKFHFFNLSSLDRKERMIRAEFRWFRKKQPHLGKSSWPHFYKVDLYEVLAGPAQPCRGGLLTSRLMPLHSQGWEVFNITQTVSKWLLSSQENNSILVVATPPSGGWVGATADTGAYVVVFSDDRRPGATNQSYLGAAADAELHRGSRTPRAPPGRPHTCQRVPLFVDFYEIGWSGWIISPRGYNAYHCRGSCPFPLGGGLRATNHATVRSIMNALQLSTDKVGAPCCVPDQLQSISLLYFDDEENVVLKQYDDMVASSCGCH